MAMDRKVSLTTAAFLLFFTPLSNANAAELDLSAGSISLSGSASVQIDIVQEDDSSGEQGTLNLLPEVGYFISDGFQFVLGLDTSINMFGSAGFSASIVSGYVGFTQYFEGEKARPYIGAGVILGAQIFSFDSGDDSSFGFVGPYVTAGLLVPLNTNVALDVGIRGTMRHIPDLDRTTFEIPFGALGIRAFF